MTKRSTATPSQMRMIEARQRILDAAFTVFTSRGYAQAGTLEIATIAKVSKRDLYTLVGKNEDLLITCISERAKRNRKALTQALEKFGYQLLLEVADPTVVSMFRLAIAEAERAPGNRSPAGRPGSRNCP